MNDELKKCEDMFALYDRMLGEVEIPAALQKVAEVARTDLNAERATVYLVNKSTHELESVALIGNIAQMIRIPIREDSLAGYCALTARAFLVADAYGDLSVIDPKLKFDKQWDKQNNFRTRDVMCAPALFKGQVQGVVQVLNSNSGTFTAVDMQLLENISRLIGYALYHTKLQDDISTLKHLEREKAKFMRVLVHELKSPVSAAKMMTDTYREYLNDHPRVEELATKIGGRMDQLVDLIKDILEFSRVQSGEPLGEISEMDLAAQTREVHQQYKEQADAKGLDLIMKIPAEAVPIRFDLQGCRLVLSNLLSNAIKYTADGSVTVSVQRQGQWVVLRVVDTGIGIPEADIPKMFGEFFRASNARQAKIQGSGVGLAGVKNLVQRFGGQMELHSKENEGSVFTVKFAIPEPKPAGTKISEIKDREAHKKDSRAVSPKLAK
ncbi:MAG: GAF domain-containing sensor histidine kinase [Sedimentisphaerales bacterium]|nr:GAF domain-containing sensor histidine kinase [Sedimentisphaerales bacterium]